MVAEGQINKRLVLTLTHPLTVLTSCFEIACLLVCGLTRLHGPGQSKFCFLSVILCQAQCWTLCRYSVSRPLSGIPLGFAENVDTRALAYGKQISMSIEKGMEILAHFCLERGNPEIKTFVLVSLPKWPFMSSSWMVSLCLFLGC